MTVANIITIVRIIIVPFFVAVVLYYSKERDYFRFIALGIFLVAAFSDALDGYIARVYDQKTKLGALLDPLADKILLVSAFIFLFQVGNAFEFVRFPIWLIVTVISRDIILILGALIIHLYQGDLEIKPTMFGKITTVLQMACIVGILLQWEQTPFLWDVTAVLTIISGLDYIRLGINKLNNGTLL